MFDLTTSIGIAAGVMGTVFVGYCIYFDRKRLSDPDYKKKVREGRRRRRHGESNSNSATTSNSGMPNLNDRVAIERYFLDEVRLGEMHITKGDYQAAVEHLANATIVCGHPARMLQVLHNTLPEQICTMLILRLQEIARTRGPNVTDDTSKVNSSASNSSVASTPKVTMPEMTSFGDLE